MRTETLSIASPLFIAWAVVAAVALVQGALTVFQAVEHRRFHRRRMRAQLDATRLPRVMLFVPCKGRELGLEENLEAFFRQDYAGGCELCFVVESADDPAVAAIEGVRSRFSIVPSRLVVAGLAHGCGQKVHNLMVATSAARHSGCEVFAFADSDARPESDWLVSLVARTCPTRPLVSGYRWMTPERPTWPNVVLAATANRLAGIAGPGELSLVWGGSWAVRLQAFERMGLPQAWQGALSDDLAVSRLAAANGIRVLYEPRCLVPSPVEFTWKSAWEFLRRQFIITRIYTPRWWWVAVAASILPVAVLLISAVAGVVW
ncbi:MAG: glycosyltransferase, partial [Planctomycetes bacterium]|nr:glycosyltransferase [Planctomycetota bacterium]